METQTWVARYRDGEGRRREVSTGCRDKTAARQVLAETRGAILPLVPCLDTLRWVCIAVRRRPGDSLNEFT